MDTCILFDLDGTLVSSGGAGIRALERAFKHAYQLPNSMKGIDPQGKTDPVIIREIFQARLNRNCTSMEMAHLQGEYLKNLPEECEKAEHYRVMKGIPKLLKQLKKEKFLLGLGTGNLERGARIKLERSGLNAYLPFGGFGSDSEIRSDLLKIGVKKCEKRIGKKISRGRIFVVGDTVRDIHAARRAYFKVIAVATGHASFSELKGNHPDHTLENFEDADSFMSIIQS